MSGRVSVLGWDVAALDRDGMRALRRRVGFVGQDPASRLNPRMRVGRLLSEVGGPGDPVAVLAEVGLDVRSRAGRLGPFGPGRRGGLLGRRPGQLSGGEARRVALGRALARRPALLLLDEPTVGLDGALRAQLTTLLRGQADAGTTVVFASHDLDLVGHLADQTLDLTPHPAPSVPPIPPPVRRAGLSSEPVRRTSHSSGGVVGEGSDRTAGGTEALTAERVSAWGDARRRVRILCGVDLSLPAGGALAVLGVSGAGKSTLARVLAGLHRQALGRLRLEGRPLPLRASARDRVQLRRVQLVPQDPLGTPNPAHTVHASLARPLRLLDIPPVPVRDRVAELLDTVGLPAETAERYPHELSGGQRQRVAIARALAAEPGVLVCDEITASLDASTAGTVLSLLDRLRADRGLSLIVITHELPLAVRHTDTAVRLDLGRVTEAGSTPELLAAPPPCSVGTAGTPLGSR